MFKNRNRWIVIMRLNVIRGKIIVTSTDNYLLVGIFFFIRFVSLYSLCFSRWCFFLCVWFFFFNYHHDTDLHISGWSAKRWSIMIQQFKLWHAFFMIVIFEGERIKRNNIFDLMLWSFVHVARSTPMSQSECAWKIINSFYSHLPNIDRVKAKNPIHTIIFDGFDKGFAPHQIGKNPLIIVSNR